MTSRRIVNLVEVSSEPKFSLWPLDLYEDSPFTITICAHYSEVATLDRDEARQLGRALLDFAEREEKRGGE